MRHIRSYAMIMVLVMFMTLTSCGGGGGSGGGEESAKDEDQGQSDTGQIETITTAQAQAALYAAYAGIGYNSGSDAADDEPLYGVMVADLNNLASDLAVQAIANDDGNALILLLMTGGSKTFTYQASGVAATLKIEYNLLTGGFSADLSIDFDAGGFTFDGVTYTGQGTDAQLTAALDGTITMNINTGTVTPQIVNVALATNSNLTATHPDFSVQYKGWNISYAITKDLVNYSLAPSIISAIVTAPATTDDRLYTLKGGFDLINGTTGSYAFNMTYGQQDLSSGVYVALQGSLSLPGFEGKVVNVSSSGLGILEGDDSIDTASSIRRTDAGVWTSGTVTITAADESYSAAFSPDGSVTLSPGNTEVENWQTALAPF